MIFLGLASNYNFRRIFQHLFAAGGARDSLALRRALAERYDAKENQIALYHSGRSALAVALSALARDGAPVIIPGLTCIAVIRAVRAAGLTPVYCDISRETLQYDYKKLEKVLSSERPGVILVQNTLGNVVDIQKIEALAKKYHFQIVEDLAHSAGRRYADGREVGTVGAAAALSFGKGKALDVICGGAAIVRAVAEPLAQPTKKPRLSERLRDRWYPVFGGLCRVLWPIGLGQPLLSVLVRLRFIEKSADARLATDVRLTHWQAKLVLKQLGALPPASADAPAALRPHYLVHNRDKLLRELLQNGYNFSEIWYDTPVAPVRYAAEADFPEKDCPVTVAVAQEIINLPGWYPEARLRKAHEIIAKYTKGVSDVR